MYLFCTVLYCNGCGCCGCGLAGLAIFASRISACRQVNTLPIERGLVGDLNTGMVWVIGFAYLREHVRNGGRRVHVG